VHASQLVELGTALVAAGLLATALPWGRYGLPLALLAAANLAAGVGNLVGGDRWSGAGNLAAACYLGGLWWYGQRQRTAGDPAWLREAMAADAAARERRWAELGLDRPGLDDPGLDDPGLGDPGLDDTDQPEHDGEVA
jgi:hypothetical protein